MTSELRPSVEVWEDAYGAFVFHNKGSDYEAAAAVIEADREAVRAEQAAELAKFKALAETLAGALQEVAYSVEMSSYDRHKVADKVLLQYTEATHD